MPWYLYLALKQLFSTRGRIFFTAISVFSVALGVAVMLIVLSVMGGFAQKLDEMTEDTQGDLQVIAHLIPDPGPIEKVVRSVPGVVATTPYAQGIAMVMYEDVPTFCFIQGIDLDTVEQVAPLEKFVRAGSLQDLDDDSVILSSKLAESLNVTMGGKVQIYSPAAVRGYMQGDEIMLPRELTVVGIFEIGHQQFDKSTVIVTLRTMQDLYKLGSAVHGIEARIAPGLDQDQETNRVNQALARAQGHAFPAVEGLWARSSRQANADFLWAVALEKRTMTLILLMVIVVAAFLSMSLLIVLVQKKTREIGLFGALGATRLEVAACFCAQGTLIGVVGAGLGLAIGFTLLHYRNEAVNLITRWTGGSADSFASVYQFQEMPAHTAGSDLAIIVISAVVLSTLGGVVPAVLAARLKPVDALRNE